MSNFASIIFYFVSLSVSALLIHRASTKKDAFGKKIYLVAGLAIPILLGCLRSNVGWDYPNYQTMYFRYANDIPQISFIEPVFFLLAKLSHILTNSSLLFFAIPNLITVIFFYLGIKRRVDKRRVGIGMWLFYLILFLISFNIVRQAAAISIIFYAATFMTEKSPKKSILLCVFAALFHVSAILMLPVILIARRVRKNKSQRRLLVIVAGSIVSILAFVSLFADQLATSDIKYIQSVGESLYITSADIAHGLHFGPIAIRYTALLSFVVFLAPLIFAYRGSSLPSTRLPLRFLSMIGLTLSITTLFMWHSERIIYYFIPFAILLMVNSVRFRISKDWILIAFAITYFFVVFYVFDEYISRVMPYHFIWESTV